MNKERDMATTNAGGGTLFQVSLLQGLSNGDYTGSVPLRELKQHGDTGIGTFDKLNGELILLDGTVYRAAGDGTVAVVPDDETSPFAVASFLHADDKIPLPRIPDFDALTETLNRIVEARGKNLFHMIRIDGVFHRMNVRSVPAQKKPYRRLSDVLRDEQTFFDFENIAGTVVGLYCPPYMSYLNAVGWHLHFISADRAEGGHVLGLSIDDAVLTWAAISSFALRLPQGQDFEGFDLSIDQSAEIEIIEKNHG